MSRKNLNGVHIPHRKNTAGMQAIKMPPPATVTIPMSMHIGKPANCIVAVGDHVNVGQMIGEPGGFVSSPVFASVSGTVKKIGELLGSNGRMMQTVEIESDGLDARWEGIQPPKLETMQDFLDAVRASGLVGLGGAGFPTVVKLTVKNLDQIKCVIINGAECEPYITSDTRAMIDYSFDVIAGCRLLQKFLKVPCIVFGIEDNKPECIERYRELVSHEQNMEVMSLKAMYPQGGEKVLIYHVTGEKVPEGKLPLDVGAVVLNCTTISSIARYCRTGLPLVKKCVTVDGSAVKNPMNVLVPIGMRMKDVFEATGGFKEEPKMVLYGGPMMGIAVPDLEQPILKNTNAILAFGEAEATPPEPTACIKCGKCIAHCPLSLMPCEMETAYKKGNIERLMHLKVNLCMECGCCSFICPAHRPLVQTNKLAKAQVMAYKNALKAKAEAEKAKLEAEKQKEAAK